MGEVAKGGKVLRPEDRIIDALQVIRYRMVTVITEIDKQVDYITRCKEVMTKCNSKRYRTK